MLNLLRAELYKLKISRFLKVLFLLDITLSAALPVLFFYFPDFFAVSNRISGSLALFDFLPVMSFFIIIILVFFCSVGITGEFSDGTVRNCVSVGMKRWQLYIGKGIPALLANISFVIPSAAVVVICSTLLNGWQGPDVPDRMVLVVGACMLYISGHTAVFQLVSFLVRSPGAAIGLNMFLFLVQIIIMLRLGDKFQFYDLLLVPYLGYCAVNGTFPGYYYSSMFSDSLLRGILLTVVIIIATTAAGCFAVKKYEIK